MSRRSMSARSTQSLKVVSATKHLACMGDGSGSEVIAPRLRLKRWRGALGRWGAGALAPTEPEATVNVPTHPG